MEQQAHACMSWNTTKHHYILPRSLCITILSPFSRNCGLFLLGDTYFCCYLGGREMMRYPISGFTFLLDSVVHYFYACDRSKQVFLFCLFLLEGWFWRAEDFFFLRRLTCWMEDGEHRARWSLPRWLLTFLRLYVFTGGIFYLIKNIQTTKVQTFTSLPCPFCPQLSYPLTFPPTYLLVSLAYPLHILNLTHHTLPLLPISPDAITTP